MPLTVEQVAFLGQHLGVALPPDYLENKQRAAEFKLRRAKVESDHPELKGHHFAEAIGKLLRESDELAKAGTKFGEAMAKLTEAEELIQAPPPPPPPESPAPKPEDTAPPPVVSTAPDTAPTTPAPDPAKAAEAKKKYLESRAKFEARILALEKDIAAGKYGIPLFAESVKAFGETKQAMEGFVAAGEYAKASVQLSRMIGKSFGNIETDQNTYARKVKALMTKAEATQKAVAAKTYDGLGQPVTDFTAAMKKATTALGDGSAIQSYPEAEAAKTALETAMKALTQAAADRVLALVKSGKKTSAVRAEVTKLAQGDPDVLRPIASSPGGTKLIDKLVADAGSSAKDEKAKAFFKAALVARYDLDALEGDLSTKATPQLYKLLGMVPDSHVKNNPSLKKIKRDKQEGEKEGGEASFYRGTEQLIVLNLGRTGASEVSFQQDDDVDKDCKMKKGGKANYFDHTTLHEIGHAVDDKLSFMKSKKGQEKFGGWQPQTMAEIADIAGDQKGFYNDWAKFPKAHLKKFLTAILEGGTPAEKVQEIGQGEATQPTADEAAKMAAHAAAKWCEGIRLVGSSDGLWERGGACKDFEIGGRIYQQSYKSEWNSYAASARRRGVTNYQFRAPGEWFSELYAAYYLGKLPKSHPDTKWLSWIDS